MSYGLTAWTTSTEITAARMQGCPDSIAWHQERMSYLFDLGGAMIAETDGVGKIEGYLAVNPYNYEGYAGAGAFFGQFRVAFPAGVFSELLFCRCQAASAGNGAMSASISQEGPGGVTVFVYDSGSSPIGGFALWVTAIGVLKEGLLA